MKKRLPRYITALALSVGAPGTGFVVFLGPNDLIDFGAKRPRRSTRKSNLAGITWLFDRYQPDEVVLVRKAGKGTLVQERIADIARLARARSIPITRYSRADLRECFRVVGAQTKEEIAQEVAKRLPEIRSRLPRPRKPWMPEQPAMLLFEAASLAIAFFLDRGEMALA